MMKKLVISVALLASAVLVKAELPQVATIEEVALPAGSAAMSSTVSPDGSFIVISDAGHQGLTKISLDGSAPVKYQIEGTVRNVTISPDGANVVFRNIVTGKDKLRRSSLVNINLSSKAMTQLVAPTRHLNDGVTVSGNVVSAVSDGVAKAHAVGRTARVAVAPVASIDYGHLTYTKDGRTTVLDPMGRGSYIWPSISPDGKKILYYLTGSGCFVCDTEGRNIAQLGGIRAAKWLDNNTVVGMNDTDNGEVIVASNIVVADLEGNRKALTDDSVIAAYPSASADGKHISFTTEKGLLYLINLK